MNTNIKKNKSLFVSVLAILLAVILSLTLFGCNMQKSVNESVATPQESEITNDFTAEIVNTSYVKLAVSAAYAAAEGGSVSKTITATVMPATAVNKAVDWSVEWGDSSNTATVTNYVTVTPDSNGSISAIVTCRQAFSGTILVTVTTRESGYTASCVVTFAGVPTDFSVSGSVSPSGGNTYNLGIGNAYTFDVGLINPFNSVGSAYNNINCFVSGVGSINVGYMEHYNATATDVWYETSNKVLTLDSIKDNFITASYSNGKLTVTTIKSVESYYSAKTRMDGGRTWGYSDKFRSCVDDCYFTVTLTEATSGISKVMTIRFDNTVVTSVNASVSEMVF